MAVSVGLNESGFGELVQTVQTLLPERLKVTENALNSVRIHRIEPLAEGWDGQSDLARYHAFL
jgi:hypothetical protein